MNHAVALIETEQATMEEVFLPYLLDKNDKTLYELVSDRKFLLAEGGDDNDR